MDFPLWIRLLGVVWLLILLATLVAVSRLGGGGRTAAMKVLLFAASVSLVIGLGLVALYARHAAAPVSPPAASTAGCDTPPAPAPTAAPPATASTPGTSKRADAKSADGKNTPNFLTFAACGEDPKAPAKKP